MPPFTDRAEAGRQLAGLLTAFRGPDVVLLALPGGGVRVASAIAAELHVRLDVMLIRALAVTRRPDLVYGILGEDSARIIDTSALSGGGLGAPERTYAEAAQALRLRREAAAYRGNQRRIELSDRTVVLVDDCLTETTALRNACRIARVQGAIRIVVAVPVGSYQALHTLTEYADKVVCAHATAQPPAATGCYRHDIDTSAADIADLLGANAVPFAAGSTVKDVTLRNAN
ncbi:phosphoribosyltransferase family protein [Nocardia crassostreae]|uniref:phosphoribosyltransferase family protein n=1 Tax=Nocardia crassostreae TaxID=53428 RepID=UPI000A5E9719|nr:phosphoribosyltransferase family protein [Nocardia crassostreae]